MTRTCRRPGGLAVLVAVTAVGLAACSGSPSSPQVASLGNSSGNSTGSSAITGSSSTTLPKGNPTELLDGWAACMRSHGDTSQADPTITANKLIDIAWNPATTG